MELIEIYFYNIFASDDDYMLIFRERMGKGRFLPMVIGTSEAGNILMAGEKMRPDRLFLSDIFFKFIGDNSCSMERLVINSLKNGIFCSEIHIKNHEGLLCKYSVRPSDGLALAIRSDCPLYAEPEVLEEIEVNPAIQETLESIHMNQGIFLNYKWRGIPGNIPVNSRQFAGQDFSLKDLSLELDIALNEENYEKAAVIRDKIREYKKISDKM